MILMVSYMKMGRILVGKRPPHTPGLWFLPLRNPLLLSSGSQRGHMFLNVKAVIRMDWSRGYLLLSGTFSSGY